MPKPNTYVQLLNAQQRIRQLEENIQIMKGFTLQQALDMAMIALHDEFQFGPKYNERFEKAFRETFIEYAKMCVSDGTDLAKTYIFRLTTPPSAKRQEERNN